MKKLAVLILSLATVLGGCEPRQDDPPESAETPDADRTPVSIIRPEMEPEREEPPLQPLEMRIAFPDGGDELDEIAKADLATLLASPQFAAQGSIVLRSHTDSAGSDLVNLRASQARGDAVKQFLVDNGTDPDRITVIAFGEQNPVAPNANPDGTPNEEGRAANRRIDVTVELPDAPNAQGKPPTADEAVSSDETAAE